jgi:hypothetical protein
MMQVPNAALATAMPYSEIMRQSSLIDSLQYGARVTPSLVAGNGAVYVAGPTLSPGLYYGGYTSYQDMVNKARNNDGWGASYCAPCMPGFCGTTLDGYLPLGAPGCPASYLTVPGSNIAAGLPSAVPLYSASTAAGGADLFGAPPGASRPRIATLASVGGGARAAGASLAAVAPAGTAGSAAAGGVHPDCTSSFPTCNDHGQCINASGQASSAQCGVSKQYCPSTAPFCWIGKCAWADATQEDPAPVFPVNAPLCPSTSYPVANIAQGCTDQFPISNGTGLCVDAQGKHAGPGLVATTTNNCPAYAPYCLPDRNSQTTMSCMTAEMMAYGPCPAVPLTCSAGETCFNGGCFDAQDNMKNMPTNASSTNCALQACDPVPHPSNSDVATCDMFDSYASCLGYCGTSAQGAVCRDACSKCRVCSTKYNSPPQ